jgi:hypothetical protein
MLALLAAGLLAAQPACAAPANAEALWTPEAR